MKNSKDNCFQFIGILKITIYQRKVNSMYKTIPRKLQGEKRFHLFPFEFQVFAQCSSYFHNCFPPVFLFDKYHNSVQAPNI